MDMQSDVIAKVKNIKLLVLDIDGVLTDGRIVYGIYGEELKFFDVHDGLGIVMLRWAGIPSAIITAKKSAVVKRRCKDLSITKVYQGYPNKSVPFEKTLRTFRVSNTEACFVGDDIIDIPAMKRAGLAVSVPNAVEEVKQHAHYVTQRRGGRGAVREICDLILKSQNKWDLATKKFFK